MKISPLLLASGALLVGVTALCALGVVETRRARTRRPAPEPEVEDAPPPPRREARVVRSPRRPPAPAAPDPALAELHVRVVGPHGLVLEDASVSAHRRGTDDDDWTALDEDDAEPAGRFSLTDLPAGRYDVRVEASGMRAVRLDDVVLGARPLDVALSRAPVLLGSVAGLGAGDCTGVSVAWSAGEGSEGGSDEEGEATVDAESCTFFADDLPDAGPLTVVATRGERRETALVTLPLEGDPSFLCLASPCAVGAASVLVYVSDGGRLVSDAEVSWAMRADDDSGEAGMSSGGGLVWIHGRRPGQTLALRAERDEQAADATTVLAAGVSEVVLTLPAPRDWRPNCFDSGRGGCAADQPSASHAKILNQHELFDGFTDRPAAAGRPGDRDLFVSRGPQSHGADLYR